MSITRRKFLASGITIVGTSTVMLKAPLGIGSSLYGNSGGNFIYADEIDMNELPFHHYPDYCSGYPYDIPEFDDEFALSDKYLHDPEIENRY